MLFHLESDTECELTSFVGRTQKSGPEDVPAVTFRLKLDSVRNEMLDLFSPTIRQTAYMAVEGQEQLPGVEITTPILRSKDLKHWAPDTRLEGWSVIVSRGITNDSALQMGTCKLDDFRFDFFEGGHMDLEFRVSTADIDEGGAGMLWGRQKRKVFATITAPELPAPAIDGSVEAFKKDHPEATATDLFAGPGDEDDDDGEDDGSEGGDADVVAARDGLSADGAWPFPKNGADPDMANASAFEAGVKREFEKTAATRSPAGSRTARGRAATKAALEAGAKA